MCVLAGVPLLSRPDRDPGGYFKDLKRSELESMVYVCDQVKVFDKHGVAVAYDDLEGRMETGDFVKLEVQPT